MIDLTGVTHHPAIEEITGVLCNMTENTDQEFFRIPVVYFLAKMASSMRATVITQDRGQVPVNAYVVALATSGYGKGHSVGIVENQLMTGFIRRFMSETFQLKADDNLWLLAGERSARNGTDPQEEKDRLDKDFHRAGPILFEFDEASSPAVKQIRYKMLLANIGAINLQVDEIGSNLEKSVEALTLFLELYDQGMVKDKLTKNSTDNQRGEQLRGKTPANALLFGTPATLLDSAKTEQTFMELLAVGYARRSLFAYGSQEKKSRHSKTAEEIFDAKLDPKNNAAITKWAQHFHDLADPGRFGWTMVVERAVSVRLIEYQMQCEMLAEGMKEHEAVHKAEMSHRHFRALKVAGALAFVDSSNEVEMDHLMQAILLVEESGAAFRRLLTREKAHERLGRYLGDIGEEVTHHDLTTELSYYPKGAGNRADMISLATAWGYRNNVIIKKRFGDNNIEFFRGETLKKTDLDKIRISYSESWAYDYLPEEAPFGELHQLTQAPGMNFCNHHFKGGHRNKENAIPGFNLLVFDVDGGIKLETVHDLLKDYWHLTYTTKRHTEDEHRFRVLMPTNYVLELDDDEYKELYMDILGWLPFQSANPDADMDTSAAQRSKKFLAHGGGAYHYHMDGGLFDVLPFIPKTSRNQEYRDSIKPIASMDNLERWFATRIGGVGSGRNNQMIKFALALVDSGLDLGEVMTKVRAFDQKLADPLGEDELNRSIFVTVAKRFQKKAA